MFKLTAKFVHATNGGVRMAHGALKTYTRYAVYSLTDRKGRQSGRSSVHSNALYEPRYSLNYSCPEDFVLSQWSNSAVGYAVYRTLVALYFVFMVGYTAIVGTLGWKLFIMLTYWSYYILTCCQILRAVNVWHYIRLKKEGKDIKTELGNCRRLKTQWVLHNLSIDTAPIVAMLFWTIAYDGSGYTLININTHGVNAAYVIVDAMITRTPIRLLHTYYSSALGLAYTTFTLVYWLAGGTNQYNEPFIYKPLNYGEKPGVAVVYILVIAFIVAPLVHSMMFFLYRFRIFIHRFQRVMDKRHPGTQ